MTVDLGNVVDIIVNELSHPRPLTLIMLLVGVLLIIAGIQSNMNRRRWASHMALIDSMNNKKIGTFEVYRIQIFESSIASIARAEAKRFQNILGDTVYIDFETPLYKLRIGNYTVRKNAEKAIKSISRLGVKNSWIIRTKTIIED